MPAYPNSPPTAYFPPYSTSPKKPSQPMSQIYHQQAYSPLQPSSNRSSYHHPSPQSPHTLPSLTSSSFSHHDSVVSYPKSLMDSYAPSTRSIVSYSLKHDTRKGSLATANASELEKASSVDEPTYPPSALSRDPEKKRVHSPSSPRHSTVRASYQHHASDRGLAGTEDDADLPVDLQAKAFSILLYLSTLNPLLSILITIWTILALLLSPVLIPLRIASFETLTYPPLRLQLQLIYSSHTTTTNNKNDIHTRPAMLILINLLSPLLAFALAAASWTTTLFWFFSAVLGDPAGKDGHNDGKAAVLWLRAKWERWLRRGLVERRSPYQHV
ncbi:hypothetical protein EJ05DRAFT_473211 [Pseudovirgaria hyperparasitica]|uniref:Uncharacterized protein n=1 Tax=Pseudovirgaria hyperparasitica TaxID=470096 RepID=A0A6A6WIX5_9PEZI|nr:uncharacterized protein EJ05DRAFT_473211 [Pseudovirgaria hyperparasitica]KAF2762299.1 hypothetical protein EJ05DRAFT_473211 [Pseudovirgaria hyperparasitica]